jgi:hypothetical protein
MRTESVNIGTSNEWLLLMHQLPPKPDAVRVKIWRSLQKIGAVQLKNSVYVLPSSEKNRKQFESIIEEIKKSKGDGFLCESSFLKGITDSEIKNQFFKDRKKSYEELSSELRELNQIFERKQKLNENELMQTQHSFGKLQRQFDEIRQIDFFSISEGETTKTLINSIDEKISTLRSGKEAFVPKVKKENFQNKIWVTRADPRVDRLASAWLISRFIDKKPKFKFVQQSEYKPKKNEFMYDMFEGHFTHVGDKCSFETLVEAFSLSGNAIKCIAEIIHDLDLNDTKFNRPETPGIGFVIKGIAKNEKEDMARVEKAFSFFDDLYASVKA